MLCIKGEAVADFLTTLDIYSYETPMIQNIRKKIQVAFCFLGIGKERFSGSLL